MRQRVQAVSRPHSVPIAVWDQNLRPILPSSFSQRKQSTPVLIAGGKFSTDEFHPDARAASRRTAAPDTARHAQRPLAGPADGTRPVPSFELSAQPAAAFTGGDRPDSGCAAYFRSGAFAGDGSPDTNSCL